VVVCSLARWQEREAELGVASPMEGAAELRDVGVPRVRARERRGVIYRGRAACRPSLRSKEGGKEGPGRRGGACA
jgi:hypothetical protein